MSKNQEYTRELAIEECKILWRYLAYNRSGVWKKGDAIKVLHGRGKLTREYYMWSCPLCEKYNIFPSPHDCAVCPWPKYGGGKKFCFCAAPESPFAVWQWSDPSNFKERQAAARRVYDLVKTFK